MLAHVTDTARELMIFKAQTTTIPYAREVAEHFKLAAPEGALKDFGFWASVVHFEMRFRSIEHFIEKSSVPNILELSSGYAFRGLQHCLRRPDIVYIDSDLFPVVAEKSRMLQTWGIPLPPNLHLKRIDATMAETYPALSSPVSVVNEGLLMYFDNEGKARIMNNIRAILQEHGGSWTTSDIYVRHDTDTVGSDRDKKWGTFFQKNKVNQNYFASFEAAEQFFYDNGFTVRDRYEPEFEKLSSVPMLFQYGDEAQLQALRERGRIQETWQLVPRH
ncbi:hypothetical protein BC792_10551 [Sphingobacterium allocomposti]|uniref:O-methyltransferase involved in polyketide biosynthesis n=1 Tax=Sphingobacterium allocomposti TaxID=415956 RepID=A0A5S5DKT7_9SPHI|nr:class I SAM-dependent methyltransferase [Sphingobacterium composti Yoo et al. 2007 non Ten et al. 2007]TYP96560.1 hypothetical protein BC792_10551 [Sphingobacterium composti Yoo et al. 2007 non Ten et al. 2007]